MKQVALTIGDRHGRSVRAARRGRSAPPAERRRRRGVCPLEPPAPVDSSTLAHQGVNSAHVAKAFGRVTRQPNALTNRRTGIVGAFAAARRGRAATRTNANACAVWE